MTKSFLSRTLLVCLLLTGSCGEDTSAGAGGAGGSGAAGGSDAGGAGHGAGGNGAGGSGAGGDSGGAGQGGSGAASTGGGGSGPDPACEALGASLQAAIDQHYAGPPQTPGGASVAVISGSCRWLGTVGEAHAGEPMTPAHLFRIASVTKTYVAATLLALVEEGALALDDTLDTYVPGVPAGDVITVRMLLRHTSGIYDYTSDVTFWQQALAQPNTPQTPQALVDVGTGHPANFAPGQGWGYSNTGFILAGMVIEAVTQTNAAAAIRQRTFDVVGLGDTFFDGEELLPAPLVTGFGAQGEDLTNAVHPSVNWTAGSVVATAGDVADWAAALYGGQVLSAPSLDEMWTPVATGDAGLSYGLGAFLYDAANVGNISPAVGHGGRLPGFVTNMLYLQNDGTVVVQMVNAEAGKNYTGILLAALYGL